MTIVDPIACPACLHEETMRARRHDREPCYDDVEVMHWHRPYGGARGQQVTRWDGGFWVCQICGLRLTNRDAGVLLDAALMHMDPNCDSITDEGVHADTVRAFKGGDS